MSPFRILAVLVVTAVLAGNAFAAGRGGGGRGGGGHGGGGHGGGGAHFGGGMRAGGGAHFGGAARFGGRSAIARSAGRSSFHAQRSFAVRGGSRGTASRGTVSNSNLRAGVNPNRGANLRSRAVHNVLKTAAVAGALHNAGALRNPTTRAQITASAAMGGWHDGRGGRNGWWRHGNGGYGWVGPLFWPFAYDDIYDYAMWDDDYGFWDYGYGDIYAGLFAPYGYDELAGYLPDSGQAGAGQGSGAPAAAPELARMCGEDSRDIAGLPIDQIQQAIAPNDAQRAALDELANASVKAAKDIRAACPTQISLTAPARLAAMQQRIEAMIGAVGTVQPPLQKFYDSLTDEQKARLNALGQDQQKRKSANASGPAAQGCDVVQSGVMDWPAAEIDARLHPTEAQRAGLTALQDASARAADLLKTSCQSSQAITPPARLEAVGKRLDTLLQAVKTVRKPLDDFYATLTDEQKAQFEAIGPRRTALADQPTATQSHFRRHHASIGGIIRHFISMLR
jgi:hypothetical protein